MGALHDCITQYREEKLSFFEIPFKSKAAVIKWEEYQHRLPTNDEIARWDNGHEINLAIVCGAVSGNLVVADFDSQDTFYDYAAKLCEKLGLTDIFDYTRAVQTSKGVHLYFRTAAPVKSAKFPKLDIKAEGGYVIAPPSVHPTGALYQFINETPIRTIDSLADVLIDLDQRAPSEAPAVGEVIAEGGRNQALASIAGSMRRRGLPAETIEAALLAVNIKQCRPPLPENEVRVIASSVSRYPPTGNTSYVYSNTNGTAFAECEADKNRTEKRTDTVQEPLSKRVEDWVRTTAGWFDTPELDRELGIITPKDKDNRLKIMQRLELSKVVERHQKISKQFRFVNTKITSLQFKTATNTGVLPVKWPLGIEKYVNTYPGNEIVIAGAPNAGKTAWLLDFIRLNQDTFPIVYFCSEMGAIELRSRLDNFPGMTIEDWKFEAVERSSDFADVIRPDYINVIDFLEMTTDLYAINSYLTAISHKLGSGLGIIAVQKKENAKYGRGQEFGLEKPKLYLSMDKGRMSIVKGKSWANKNVDPHGLQVNFKITGGCQFKITKDWDWQEEEG